MCGYRPEMADTGGRQGFENRGVTAPSRPKEPARWLERLRGPGERDPAGIERDLAWLEGPNRTLLTEDDPRYPPQLAAVPGMPPALFVEGDPAVLSQPAGRDRRQPRRDGRGARDRLRICGPARGRWLRDHERARGRHRRAGAPRRARRAAASRSRSAEPGSTACIRRHTVSSRRASRQVARWSASFRPARRHSRKTSRSATG